LHYGDEGQMYNYYRRDLQELSIYHRELTLMYGALFEYAGYEQISSIGTNNLFNMLTDFATFMEKLYDRNAGSIVVGKSGNMLEISQLTQAETQGIQIITEILGELETIRSDCYVNKTSSDKQALKAYMLKSSDYFHTQDVQKNVELIVKYNIAS